MQAENDDFGLDLSDDDGEGVSAVVSSSHGHAGEDARAEGAAASAAEAGGGEAAAVETTESIAGIGETSEASHAYAKPDAGAAVSETAPPVAAATADAPMPDATVPESEGAVNAEHATTATTTDEGPVRLCFGVSRGGLGLLCLVARICRLVGFQ